MGGALQLQKIMTDNNFIISIRDNFENLIGKSVLRIVEKKIQNETIELHIKKRIFSVIVECVQNICNTQDSKDIDSILLMSNIKNGYQIYAGSRVDESKKKRLENLLNKLSSMSFNEIRSLWREVLKQRNVKEGLEQQEELTFIELYLRSEGNVKAYFHKEGNESYCCMVKIEIINE